MGFILDSNLTMLQHEIRICQTAYYELKRISSVRSYPTDYATKHLVTSRVLSILDCCNSLLVGTPNSVIQPKQKVQNAAAHLFSDHHAINSAHPSYSNFTGFRFLNASNIKLHVCVKTQLLVPPPLTSLNYCSCTSLPALSALHQTHAYSNSDASTAKLMAFALSLTSVLAS